MTFARDPVLSLLAQAPDPGLDGHRPRSAAQWLRLGTALGLEGIVPALADAGLLAVDKPLLRQSGGLVALAGAEQAPILKATTRALHALAAADLAAAPLKGPLLGARLYPPSIVRRSSDVDLLVRRADLTAALEVLESLGYRSLDAHLNAAQLRHHHHLLLVRPNAPTIELHFAALHALGAEIAAEELLERSQAVVVALPDGATWHGRVLRPLDELLYLAAHAVSHHFERPLWTLDIAALACRAGPIDWHDALALAQRWHLRRGILHALAAAARQCGAENLGADLPRDGGWLAAWTDRGRDRFRQWPSGTIRRFLLGNLCALASCDDPWRAAWLGQYLGLRALGDVADRAGMRLPAGWPPLPPTAP